jgi:hypothetical protein
MTNMTADERNALVAAMSDKTAMGRLNAGEITACFDRLVELGYDIVKRPAVVEPKVAEETAPEPVHMTTSQRKAAKPK